MSPAWPVYLMPTVLWLSCFVPGVSCLASPALSFLCVVAFLGGYGTLMPWRTLMHLVFFPQRCLVPPASPWLGAWASPRPAGGNALPRHYCRFPGCDRSFVHKCHMYRHERDNHGADFWEWMRRLREEMRLQEGRIDESASLTTRSTKQEATTETKPDENLKQAQEEAIRLAQQEATQLAAHASLALERTSEQLAAEHLRLQEEDRIRLAMAMYRMDHLAASSLYGGIHNMMHRAPGGAYTIPGLSPGHSIQSTAGSASRPGERQTPSTCSKAPEDDDIKSSKSPWMKD